jgi:hypothetical protein
MVALSLQGEEMMHRIIRLLVLVPLLFGATTLVATAQDGTPVVDDGFPIVADPSLCTVEPRDSEALLDLWFPPDATPIAADTGTDAVPADATIPIGEPLAPMETIVVGITMTVQEVLACFSAGDFARATALFTEDLVATFAADFGPEETREVVAAFLEDAPVPEAGAEPIELLAITNVMLLEDGRVGAFVVDREVVEDQAYTSTVYVVFEQGGNRWLVDEVVEFPSFFPEEEE